MHTKVISLSFTIDSKNSQEYFKHNSVYELTFTEGISALYHGTILLYSTEALKASELGEKIGKVISIHATISDELEDQKTRLNIPFVFERYFNGLICSINFLGDSFEVTTDSNDTVYKYQIDFVSPYELLTKINHKYQDTKIGAIKDKLEMLLSTPSRIVYGTDHSKDAGLPIHYTLLDKDNIISKLPDNVTLQLGAYTPLCALRQILLDYGLNFCITHSHTGNNKINVFLSKGYGIKQGSDVISSYFSQDTEELENIDNKMVITCNKGYDGSPKLNSIKVEVLNQELSTSPLSNSFLSFSNSKNVDALQSKANATVEVEKNYVNKQKRENQRYHISASQLIFTPGTVINTQNYIGDSVKLIVDSCKLHICCKLNKTFNASDSKPSIDCLFTAYEINHKSEPGSFSAPAELGMNVTTASSMALAQNQKDENMAEAFASHMVLNGIPASSSAKILEATVSDGDGKYSGVWDTLTNEPRNDSICIFAGDDTVTPSKFYALPDGYSTPVCVNLTSFTGFNDSFTFPRIGQRILIICSDNNFYLHSYLTPRSTEIVEAANRDNRNNTLSSIKMLTTYDKGARVHIWNAQDKSKNTGITGFNVKRSSDVLSDIILEKNSSIHELIKNKILAGTESSIVEAMVLQSNNYVAYKNYDDTMAFDTKYLPLNEKLTSHPNLQEKNLKARCSKTKQSFLDAKAELKEQKTKVKKIESEIIAKTREQKIFEAQIRAEEESAEESDKKKLEKLNDDLSNLKENLNEAYKVLDTKKTAFSKAETDINAVTNEFKDKIGVPNDFANSFTDVFKIDHNGNMEINVPTGTLTINAKNIKISASDSTSVQGTGNISITTTKKISLGSRGSTITVVPNAIKAKSIPFVNGALSSFGSSLNLDSFAGASLSGSTASVKGKFSASVGDEFGASLKASKGIASVKGIEASLGTCTYGTYMESLIKFDASLVEEGIKSGIAASGRKERSSRYL